MPLAPGIGSNLDAKVTTTLAQAGIVSRPLPKLTLRGDLRYEDRDDKTPGACSIFTAPGSTSTGHNEPRSIRTTKGLAEASYLLPREFRLTGGIGYEEKKRNTSDVRIVSYRETTEETSYRVELRRSMSETLTGAISYVYSDRDGSPFITTTQTSGAMGSNLIAPIHLADRKRDKVRVSSNWTPIDPLSIQLFVDWADDRYSGRDGSGLGPRKGEARNYSLDAAYTFSDKWQANAWYNRNETRAEQSTCEAASSAGVCPATAADPVYAAEVRNKSDSFGFGVRGKPNARVEVGADLSYSDIKDSYFQQPLAPADAATAAAAARHHDAPHPVQPVREIRAREEIRSAARLHLRPLQHQRLDLDQLRVRRRHPPQPGSEPEGPFHRCVLLLPLAVTEALPVGALSLQLRLPKRRNEHENHL